MQRNEPSNQQPSNLLCGHVRRILPDRVDRRPVRGLQIFDGVAYYTTGEPEEPNQLWSVPVVGANPTLLRDDVTWTNDFEVDPCAITVGTFDGALERIKR